MPQPRYRRRKEDRPQEITAAAFDAFAENGYAATPVEEVARRAGVSKGLLYLYFRTKEELFKAVVRSVVMPRVSALEAMLERSQGSAEDFIRGPLADFMKRLPGSRVAIVMRLMIAEASKHPDLVEFYWDNVVSRGMRALKRLLDRGVEQGEFRPSGVNELPQILIAPVVLSVVWRIVFEKKPLDTDRLIDTHIELVLAHIRSPSE